MELRVRRIHRNKFNHRFLESLLTEFREEHGTVVGATQVLAEVEFSICDQAFPLSPSLSHFATLPILLMSVLTPPRSDAGCPSGKSIAACEPALKLACDRQASSESLAPAPKASLF